MAREDWHGPLVLPAARLLKQNASESGVINVSPFRWRGVRLGALQTGSQSVLFVNDFYA
jgi:hypothetical protein